MGTLRRMEDWVRMMVYGLILSAQIPAFLGIVVCYLYLRGVWWICERCDWR